MENQSSVEPVTISGWYELRDGKLGKFVWRGGFPQLVRIAEDWLEVARLEAELEAEFGA